MWVCNACRSLFKHAQSACCRNLQTEPCLLSRSRSVCRLICWLKLPGDSESPRLLSTFRPSAPAQITRWAWSPPAMIAQEPTLGRDGRVVHLTVSWVESSQVKSRSSLVACTPGHRAFLNSEEKMQIHIYCIYSEKMEHYTYIHNKENRIPRIH